LFQNVGIHWELKAEFRGHGLSRIAKGEFHKSRLDFGKVSLPDLNWKEIRLALKLVGEYLRLLRDVAVNNLSQIVANKQDIMLLIFIKEDRIIFSRRIST
jgi:hypothetical protein